MRFSRHTDNDPQAYFTKGPLEETITITYNETNKEIIILQKTKLDILTDNIKEKTIECNVYDGKAYTDCISDGIRKEISIIEKSKETLLSYRNQMSTKLVNYVCNDDLTVTSEGTENTTYIHPSGNTLYNKHTISDTDGSRIWVLEKFLTTQDCIALKSQHISSSALDSTLPEHEGLNARRHPLNNKTPQPLIDVHVKIREAFLHENSYLSLSNTLHEDIYTISYNKGHGQGTHCDGQGDGKPASPAARVATAILTCEAPVKGGVTIFPQAGLVIKPSTYDVTFIVNVDPSLYTNEGNIARCECPVRDGSKFQSIIHYRLDDDVATDWAAYLDRSGSDSEGDDTTLEEDGMSEGEVDVDGDYDDEL